MHTIKQKTPFSISQAQDSGDYKEGKNYASSARGWPLVQREERRLSK